MIFNLLFSFFIMSSGYAFDKDFRTVNDRVPFEFNALFDSMKLSIKTPAEKIRFVGLCKDLDDNLGNLQKEHIFLLVKSEVIKNVLNHGFPKVRSYDITTFLISRLQENLKKSEKYLSPFSKWIWRSILAELNYRKEKGLITANSFDAGGFADSKRSEALRFERYLKYLLPWIDKMDSLSPFEFNKLTKQVSWTILRRLNERSLLFKRFASTATTDTKITLFNIPGKLLELHPEEIKRMQSDNSPMTLKEESEKAKSEARDQVESVTPDDLSPLSDEVSKELDQKVP